MDHMPSASERIGWEQLAAFEEAHATDLRVGTLRPTPEEADRTRALLRALCRKQGSR
jgi:hypothetical protein